MSNQKARVIVLPTFSLTVTCDKGEAGAQKTIIPDTCLTEEQIYYRRSIGVDYDGSFHSNAYKYNFYPLVLSADGSPWKEANLFILWKLEASLNPTMSTFQSIASDLADYKNYITQEDIDPFDFPKRKLLRPTYRYRNFNVLQAQAGEISLGTAKRRVSTVVAFYKWVIQKSFVKIENSPWVEKSVHIPIQNRHGATLHKKVKTTDLSIKAVKSKNPYSETIQDGGELKPLTPKEQVALFDALAELGNVEMTLIHLIAFFTGARIQTVLTLRASIFQDPADSNIREFRIKVGPGTGVDTKNDKPMTLFFPNKLYERLNIYARSNRAQQRKALAKEEHLDYLFLTNRGTPYYDSKDNI